MIRECVVRGRRNPLHFTIAQRLKKARESKGWSARKLALAAGLSDDSCLAIEAEGRIPGVDTVERIADALGCSPCYLAYGVDSAVPSSLAGGVVRTAGCGTRVARLRKHRRLSLRGLGDEAQVTGAAIQAIESGRVVPSVATAEQLAKALGCSPCWLAFGEGTDPLQEPARAAAEAAAVKYRPPRKPLAPRRRRAPKSPSIDLLSFQVNHQIGEMMKASNPRVNKPALSAGGSALPEEQAFAEVVAMIEAARGRALATVNTTLIELYWQVGEYISRKLSTSHWGEGVVDALARYIARRHPGLSGFTRANLFRMRQFYDTYRQDEKVAPLVRQLSWSHNLLIMSRCKRPEEREFYLRLAQSERWPRRELERQLAGALFERAVLNPPQVSAALKEMHPSAEQIFRDTYLVEFLELPDGHQEADLHKSLLQNLQRFLSELGRDFCFVGSEVILQVGGKDFALDLLFFHRALNSLVAIELKIDEFQPEHLGKLNFYLEALDRDVRKAHENPSIGLLLCASKNNKVVEYALSRSLSPALVAEYQTYLPDKKLLQAKLDEFYDRMTERAVQSQDNADDGTM